MQQKKIVLFGAGKIGRSFIGQVFAQAGFELVFIDIDRDLITLLNQKKQYHVIIKSERGEKKITIENSRGVHAENSDQVIQELASATLACVSVGQQGLSAIIPVIAKALIQRKIIHGHWALDIIIAENMRNADAFILENMRPLLPPDFPINEMLGLVETSIGKMVPIMTKKDLEEDPLQVFAEPYNSLIVAKNGFKNAIPLVQNLAPKENIKAWVDRKLFIHNLGHSTMAYHGFLKNKNYQYIYQAADDSEVYTLTRNTMLQSAEVLLALYPKEFTKVQLQAHVDDLLHRFRNRALGDTIFRVGCDLYRKLGPEDRFVAPVTAAIKLNKPFDLILQAMLAGISFRATDESGEFFSRDKQFFRESENGVKHILNTISQFPEKVIQVMNLV